MKAISSRYIQKKLLVHFLMIYSIFISVIWFTQSLRFLELITAQGVDFSTFIHITGFLVLPMSYVCIPMAMFFATLLTFSNLDSHNELVILKTAGVSNLQLYAACLKVLIIIFIIHTSISLYFLPKSYKGLKEMQHMLRNTFISAILEEGVFNTQNNAMTVYIEEKESDKSYKGIFIYDIRNKEKPVTMMAHHGQLITTEQGPGFILYNGTHQVEDKATGNISLGFFKSYNFVLKAASNQEERIVDINELFLNDLLTDENKTTELQNQHTVHAAQRILWPLCNFILPIIAITALLGSIGGRDSPLMKQIRAGTIGIAFITLLLMMNNLAMKHFVVIYLSAALIISGFIIPYTYSKKH